MRATGIRLTGRLVPSLRVAVLWATSTLIFVHAVSGQEACSVSILNQSSYIQPDGSWTVANVPANMGQVRARVNCQGTGTVGTTQCSVTTINGNGTFSTSGFSQSGAGDYQHAVLAYEVTTQGCLNCPAACGTWVVPIVGPTCAACTTSVAASCCVHIP